MGRGSQVPVKELVIDGLRVAYREQGAGVPLVLLHGWPLDGREWWRQLDELSDEFHVVAWDAPGAGRSSDPSGTATLEDWAGWLAAFIDRLGLAPAHVAGLSYGGGLALELFRSHPKTVRSLVLMSAYAGWAGSLPPAEVRRRVELTRRNTRQPPSEWVPALVDTLLPTRADPALVDELTVMLSASHPDATWTVLRDFGQVDLRPMLAQVDVPALLVYGELDVRTSTQVRESLRDAIPGAELVVIPGVGHMVDLQAPRRCNAALRSFLRRVDAA